MPRSVRLDLTEPAIEGLAHSIRPELIRVEAWLQPRDAARPTTATRRGQTGPKPRYHCPAPDLAAISRVGGTLPCRGANARHDDAVDRRQCAVVGNSQLEAHAGACREVQPRGPMWCVPTLVLACLCPCHSKRSRPSTPRGLGLGETPLERWTGVTVGRTRAFGPIATPSQRQSLDHL